MVPHQAPWRLDIGYFVSAHARGHEYACCSHDERTRKKSGWTLDSDMSEGGVDGREMLLAEFMDIARHKQIQNKEITLQNMVESA